MNTQNLTGDCLDVMRQMPDKSVDLVFCSPPYEDARTYGIGFKLKGQEWVDWCIPRFMECLRISKGLVAWVVNGRQSAYRWTATPAMLMVDLHRAGVCLRRPKIFSRRGIPGSGGPDDLANCYEWIVCATGVAGRLPWSDNLAMGKPWKHPPGGTLSYRMVDGERVNVYTMRRTSGYKEGDTAMRMKGLTPKDKANPGDVIDCGSVGGGHMGSRLCHENEAPFPEKLAEFFVRSFCPPGGTVLDCFGGSGTTAAVAVRHGRNAISIDVRESQTELTGRRLLEVAA